MNIPLFKIINASKSYGKTQVLHEVSLEIMSGDKLAIIGESGSGKTTLLECLTAQLQLTSGRIEFQGMPLKPGKGAILRLLRSQSGIIMQDPASSFNPFLTLRQSILEPVKARHQNVTAALAHAQKLAAAAGLPADFLSRYPHEFSGGGRQRLAAVRAFVTQPQILFADEPVSSLDVLAKAQFVRALQALATAATAASATATNAATAPLTTIIVTHNLEIVPDLATQVAVLERGKLVESGAVNTVFQNPQHPYTKKLLSAADL